MDSVRRYSASSMNRTNTAAVPSQRVLMNQQPTLKAPTGSNSPAENEVLSIISSITNDINSAHKTFGEWGMMPALTSCECQNDMKVSSPSDGPQTMALASACSGPHSNPARGIRMPGSYGVGSYTNPGHAVPSTSSTSYRPHTSISGGPYNPMHGLAKPTSTSIRPHTNLSWIDGRPYTSSMHGYTKPPLIPVTHHANPVVGISNTRGSSPYANGNKYRAASLQPAANSLLPNMSGNISTGVRAASVCPAISRPAFNQNSVLIQDMQQLQQPLRSGPTCELGVRCAQIVQQYISDWNSRTRDNDISSWRNFVAKYYACGSKRRLCMSACNDQQSPNSQQYKVPEKWQCAVCRKVSDQGCVVSFKEMAQRFQKIFKSMKYELLSLGPCTQPKYENGNIVLFYEGMEQRSMCQSGEIVRNGSLMVTFNAELKILQWDFCLHHIEMPHSTSFMSTKLDELLLAGKMYEESLGENELGGEPELAEKVIKMGCKLAKSWAFQGADGMNGLQHKINLTESVHKSNPTSDGMPECQDLNKIANLLKRSSPDNEPEMDQHHGQRVTRQRLEENTSNKAQEELEHHVLDEVLSEEVFSKKTLEDLHAWIAKF